VFPAQSINWKELTAGNVVEFISSRAKKLSLVSRQNPAIAMRSPLRFLAGKGLIQAEPDAEAHAVERGTHICDFGGDSLLTGAEQALRLVVFVYQPERRLKSVV
jgi:hypothetical protein